MRFIEKYHKDYAANLLNIKFQEHIQSRIYFGCSVVVPHQLRWSQPIQSQMIVLKRLQRLSLCLTDAPLFLAFSSAKARLSDAGEQAVWAHRIIKLIKDPVVPTELGQPSILEQIEAMDVPEDCKFEFKRQENKYANKTEVMKIMTEGINLNMAVYKQKNIQKAEQSKIHYQPDTQWFYEKTDEPIIFHPSYIGTTYIFKVLDNPDQQPFVLTGKTGIGKTLSIIFYIHLNNFLTKYAVQCSKESQLQQQLKLLQSENMLNQKFLKYWYWNVDYYDTINEIFLMEKLILEQAVQLDQKEKDILLTCKDFNDFRLQLAKLFPKSIQTRVIADQVDNITYLMRRSNNQQEIIGQNINQFENKTSKRDQRIRLEIQFSQFYRPAFILRRILRKFITLGATFGVSSSHPIERELIKNELAIENSQDEGKKPTRLAFNFDQSLKHFRIPYETMALSPQGRVDFWNTGWFEIWRRLKTINVDPKIVKKLKKTYINTIRKNKVSSYFKFARLRQYMDRRYFESLKTQSSNPENFGLLLKGIFKEYPKICLYKEDQDLKYTQQQSLLYILQDLIFSKISNESQRNKLASFDLSLFEGFKFSSDKTIYQKIQYIYGCTALQIKPFKKQNEKTLTFYWTYQELYEITTHFLFPNVDFYFFTNYSPLLNLHVKQSGGARGASLERIIKQKLTQKTFSCFHYPVAVQDSSEVKQENMKIHDALRYTPNSHQTFQKDFEMLLYECKIMKNCYFVATPEYAEYSVKNYHVPSIGIDFIIAKYEKDNKRHLVRTYKITALGDCSETVKRFKESGFPQLSKMAQAGGYDPKDIKFEHIVLSLRKTIDFEVYKGPKLPHQVTIFFSDVTKLQFSGFFVERELSNLYSLQRYSQVVQQFRNHAASAKTN